MVAVETTDDGKVCIRFNEYEVFTFPGDDRMDHLLTSRHATITSAYGNRLRINRGDNAVDLEFAYAKGKGHEVSVRVIMSNLEYIRLLGNIKAAQHRVV